MILTNDQISDIWEAMPGQPGGWLKEFGYIHFAQAIERAAIATHLASQSQATRAVPEGYVLVPVKVTPKMRNLWPLLTELDVNQIWDRMLHAASAAQEVTQQAAKAETAEQAKPELTVWYGPMPESNGKSNFTATLKRKGASMFDTDSYTFSQSEYPDRVRYEADRVRYLIGELVERPFILDYDADKHSGYAAPQAATTAIASTIKTWRERIAEETGDNSGKYAENMTPLGWLAMEYEIADLRAALARAPLPAQQVQAVDVARDAARYRVLRLHVMPGDVRLAMTQLPPKAQTPPDRIDLLCDIEISRTNTSGGSKE